MTATTDHDPATSAPVTPAEEHRLRLLETGRTSELIESMGGLDVMLRNYARNMGYPVAPKEASADREAGS